METVRDNHRYTGPPAAADSMSVTVMGSLHRRAAGTTGGGGGQMQQPQPQLLVTNLQRQDDLLHTPTSDANDLLLSSDDSEHRLCSQV